MRRLFQLVLIASTLVMVAAAAPQTPVPSLVVHEWGTFTSIAGADGHAMQWVPLAAPSDLPCFVERSPGNLKVSTGGTVRMETPVLYFYSPRATDASVHVGFPQGLITEWYPHATVPAPRANVDGDISWPVVAIQPGATASFPAESGPSHYYAARNTDADAVRVGAKPEKFLFYRGVGQFQPSIAVVAREDGAIAVTTADGRPLGGVIYFESRRGTMTFSAQQIATSQAVLPRPSLDDASGVPVMELKRMLVSSGLYDREAQAMLDTWKDSWFEEGARLLYVVPRADVDRILPLTITPKPSTVSRVFVGRVEVMTPATLHDVRAAIDSGDRAMLARYGRFLQPIADRIGLTAKIPAEMVTASSPPACR